MNTRKRTSSTLASAVVASLTFLHISADAAVITIAPGNVTASSAIGAPFDRIDDHIVNGNGLTAGLHTNAVKSTMWLSAGTAFGGDDLDPSVLFDLGDVYTINSFHVWNYNEINIPTRGVNSVTVDYGTTAGLGSTVPGISNFAIASGQNGDPGEDFSGFTPFNARYIKFDINTNHGGDNNFYGLSEVQFDGVLVPEPGSVTLAGLSVLALAFRRRRS